MRKMPPHLWEMLGKAEYGSSVIRSIPADPDEVSAIVSDARARGLFGCASLDGSSLSLDEIRNLTDRSALTGIGNQKQRDELASLGKTFASVEERNGSPGRRWDITPEDIIAFNRSLFEKVDKNDSGKGYVGRETGIRKGKIDLSGYQGVPARDCRYLLERLCSGLSSIRESFPLGEGIISALLTGMLAHIYLSWILPFSEGNGRTARIVEFQILSASGIPESVLYLLNEYYFRTQRDYQANLYSDPLPSGDLIPFMTYSIGGLISVTGRYLERLFLNSEQTVWEDHIRQKFSREKGKKAERQKILVIEISREQGPVSSSSIRYLTRRVAKAYEGTGEKTIARDLKRLVDLGLIERSRGILRARKELLRKCGGFPR
ncbi:MAG: Fic family protein [Candidatus Krumholzibacteriota bacterium]|nr:Fic family protein [Candidatus Krumholzibacteriota bacterium]